MKILMFPGQGSQRTGMGDQLFKEFPEIVDACEKIFQEEKKSKITIREISSSTEQANLLNRTEFTQPILYLVNALSYQSYQKSLNNKNEDHVFIGHSLGEYNALHAAGGFDFFTGFRMVIKRGKLMSQTREGKMLAVLGLDDTTVEEITNRYHSEEKPVEVANYNSPGQIIVSGSASALEPLEAVFKEAGAKKAVWLPVSGAFHSSLMKEVASQFEKYLKSFSFSPLKNTVYANTTALPYPKDSIPSYLTRQIFSPVKWTVEIQNIRQNYPTTEFIEIGPGQVLTGLVKRI